MPGGLTEINSTLFFKASDGVHGEELWQSDGTTSGTLMVKDIYPGKADSLPVWLTEVNGTLFFSADDGVHGDVMWTLEVAGGCENCIFLPIVQ